MVQKTPLDLSAVVVVGNRLVSRPAEDCAHLLHAAVDDQRPHVVNASTSSTSSIDSALAMDMLDDVVSLWRCFLVSDAAGSSSRCSETGRLRLCLVEWVDI